MLVVFSASTSLSHVTLATADEKTTYDDHVKAIFAQRCAACHNPNKRSGDLDVTNYTNLIEGSASGTVVEAGDLGGSRLFELVSHNDEPVMPPDGKIPQTEIDLIKKWIDGGALENMASKVVVKKPMVLSTTENPLERPQLIAMPPRLPLQPVIHTESAGIVQSIATSPWSPLAAVAGYRQILLYNTQTLKLVGVLAYPEGAVNVVRFSRNGKVLLAAGGQHGASGKVVLWDVASGERITVLGDEFDAILAADISADHSQVAVGGSQRTIKVYSTETGKVQFEMTKPTDWVTAIEFSPDGVLLATGDRNGGLFVWEAMTGREYLTLKGHSGSINSLSWRWDSNVLASASKDTTVRLWEMENGGQIRSIGAHGGGATAIEFTRDGRILSTGRDRVTKLWGQDGNQLKAFPAANDISLSTSWCDETSRAIAGDFTGEIRVWNFEDAKHLATLTPNPPTIEQRLAQARTQHEQKLAALAPLKTNLEKLSVQVGQFEQELVTAQKAKTEAEQAVFSFQSEIQSANAEKTQTDQVRAQLTEKLSKSKEAKPLVAEALRNLVEATNKLTGNAELKKQADALAAQIKQIDGEISNLQAQLSGLETKITQKSTQIVAASDKMKQAQQQLQSATQNVTTIEAKLNPLKEQHQAATSQVVALESQVQTVTALVQRWHGEIDFVNQLAELNARLEAAQAIVAERQTELDAANTKLTEAKSAADAAQQSSNSATADVQSILIEIARAKGIK